MRKYGLYTLSLLILSLAACNRLQSPSPDEIVHHMREATAGTAGRHLLLEVTPDTTAWPDPMTVEVWEKGADHWRMAVRQAEGVPWDGMIMVVNGSQAWLYDPQRGEVTIGTPDTVRLPVVQDVVLSVQELLFTAEISHARLLGSERWDRGLAYKVGLDLPDGSQVTIWVDSQTWQARKVEFNSEELGHGLVVIRAFESPVEIPDHLFVLDVPEGTRVVNLETAEAPPPSATLEQVRQQVTFPLLLPTYLPPGSALTHVALVDGVVALTYGPAPNTFTLVQGPAMGAPPPVDAAQMVNLRGIQGTLILEAGQGLFLSWEENGISISIAGPLSETEAFHIAESLR
ncbi:MAG: DUF4367 domain-containing protein [Anaerolineae bacterium]|nr:DUF4367 domain-containing protein [Anaerolineae bacterium]